MIIWCLLVWAWFAQILMVGTNLGAQYKLNYPIVFGALLWGCSKGAHLQMFICCLLSWAWLDQILLCCRKSWNTLFCNGCVLGWLGPSKSLAHALICLFLFLNDICQYVGGNNWDKEMIEYMWGYIIIYRRMGSDIIYIYIYIHVYIHIYTYTHT